MSLEDPGSSQRGAPGVNRSFHRVGAGELDESGWCHAASTTGGFSVSLPNVFNDFTMTPKAEDGVEIKISVVGTLNKNQVKFSAVGTSRPDGKFKVDPLKALPDQFEKRGELKEKHVISLGRMEGIEFRYTGGSSSGVIRLYKAPTMLYQLIVEAPNSIKPADIEADAKRFLDSFAVEEKAQQ
ncbi:MAG: hypothetical protein JWM11_2708 [Planctomycetaceae bacterium]|nr:hypothetical protein [Planctomycetaceae bacterium]